MRGEIPEQTWSEIDKRLARLPNDWLEVTFPEQQLFLMHDLKSNGATHISLVCLYDACRRFESARECVFEASACTEWYRRVATDIDDSSRERSAVLRGRFYSEYCYLFLYAIGEDIAEFVLTFANLSSNFRDWRDKISEEGSTRKIGSSRQKQVRKYMCERHPTHGLTQILLSMRSSKAWKTAIHYRNTWVHDKPPIVAGFGIEYDRRRRIFEDGGKRGFGLGTWSKPAYTVDEIVDTAREATNLIAEVIAICLTEIRGLALELSGTSSVTSQT